MTRALASICLPNFIYLFSAVVVDIVDVVADLERLHHFLSVLFGSVLMVRIHHRRHRRNHNPEKPVENKNPDEMEQMDSERFDLFT